MKTSAKLVRILEQVKTSTASLVFADLLSNSLKFSISEGTIRIFDRPPRRRYLLTIILQTTFVKFKIDKTSFR